MCESATYHWSNRQNMVEKLTESEKSEIIEMALSDHTSFNHIKKLNDLKEDDVKKLMRSNLKKNSYQAWRKRVRVFSNRRASYK